MGANTPDRRPLTYAQFHLVFLVPALLVALVASMRAVRKVGSVAVWGFVLMPLIVVAYTTPWDAYLVRERIWWYGEDRVLATILGVPVEEYVFFVLQTFLMAFVLYAVLERAGVLRPQAPKEPFAGPGRVRWLGAAGWLVVAIAGGVMLGPESTRYLGLILVWAAPILALIWLFGGPRLWGLRGSLIPAVLGVSAYLWVADRVAIGSGIWTISGRYTVGWAPLGLPVEEALFFLVTNLMVTTGLTIFTLYGLTRREAKGAPGSSHGTLQPGAPPARRG